MQQFVLVAEQLDLPHERHRLGDDGGDGGSPDAHVQTEDEDGVEDGVHQHRSNGGIHGFLRMARRAQQGVQTEIKVGDDIAYQDDLHIVARIGQGVVARPEEIEDGGEQWQGHQREQGTQQNVEHEHVTQDATGGVIVFLSQLDGGKGGGTHTYQRAEGGGDVHQGEGDGDA